MLNPTGLTGLYDRKRTTSTAICQQSTTAERMGVAFYTNRYDEIELNSDAGGDR